MQHFIFEKFESLKVRILGGIFFIFILAMGMVMYGVWTYQRDRLIDLTSQRTMQLSDVIVAGLRTSMLQNNKEESVQSINTILRVAGTSRISVLDTSGKVIMTTDPAINGKVLDKMTYPSCLGCHVQGESSDRTIVIDQKGEQFISTATVIRNEPACYGCHAREQDTVGVLLVESSFSETAVLLKQMEHRIVLTGLFALVISVLLVNYIVTRFFVRPLGVLQKGFEQVGRGKFDYWVDVSDSGEIGHMADSFNVMSRALGRYVEEIKEKTEEVSAHYIIVNSLSRTIEKKVLKEVVIDLLSRLLRAECVAMALSVEKYTNIFEVAKIQRGDKRHYHGHYNTDSGELEMCALRREDLIKWSTGQNDSIRYIDDGSRLLLPLKHEKFSIGILSVEKGEGRVFSPAEMKIVPILVHHISVALANAQLYDMAITDSLTTLYTKRYFQQKIRDFISGFHVSKRGFCLLMLDLDNFKQVNDKYGHPAGDHVLMRFGELIRAKVRHGDLPFRFGGEEFVVLLRGDQIEDAVRTAERIRQSAERMELQIPGISPFSVTVSIGVACFPHHFTTAEELVGAADTALYEAKRKGRNQVAVYCDNSANRSGCY